MGSYKNITAREAVGRADVEAFQAGEWCSVANVAVSGTTTRVRWAEGGSHTAPSHFFTFRVPLSAKGDWCPNCGGEGWVPSTPDGPCPACKGSGKR